MKRDATSAPGASSTYPSYSPMFSTGIDRDKRVMFIGDPAPSVYRAIEWFRAQGVVCMTYFDFVHAFAVLQNRPESWSFVFVDIDQLGSLEEAVEAMIRLRAAVPGVSVVSLSAGFQRNDFGFSRLVISDASLRLPLTLAALELAVDDAPKNNSVWRRRGRSDAAGNPERAPA